MTLCLIMAKHKILGPLTATWSSLIFISFLQFLSHAKDTIRPKDTVGVNQTLVSAGGVFGLGFFTDGFSGSYYLGIWFAADQMKKPVWVANRESNLIDPSGVLQLRADGNLVLIDQRQWPFIINSDSIAATTNTSATLLDTGNLVLLTETNNSVIWQSFDHPTDTLLPGMKIGRFGLNSDEPRYRVLFSSVSAQSPAPGSFIMGVDNNSLATLTVWRSDGDHMDIGFWERGKLRFIFENSSVNYNFSYVSTEEETYFSFNSPGNNVFSRWFVMAPNGNLDEYTMSPDWKISSMSHPLCEDSAADNTGKCLTPFKCEGDDNFTEMNGTMPMSLLLSGSINLGFIECELMCRSNCSCSAFAAIQGDQTGCQLYYGQKSDLLEIVEKGPGIVYVRGVAPKESDGEKKWKFWLAFIVLLASLWVLIIILIGWCCHQQWKKREDQVQNQSQVPVHRNEEVRLYRMGSIINRSPNNQDEGRFSISRLDQLGGREQDEEFPLFSFHSIETATNYFSPANKIGQGGFGTIYKGRLAGGGQEIAVKRLSKISSQGMEEFINEVTVISKLQHRNLVKLLGCCNDSEESILIYEYMSNRSLDLFIFDSSLRRVILDWRERINIIEGVAQGLLYLHKYSRLKIIHRDLKTSNILLDSNMNPKISDFGMARIFGDEDTRVKTKRVVGTYGYMSPEYAMDGLFSEKSDVFSFGVILLEIVSGKKNIAFFETDQSLNLLGKAWNLWKEGKSMELMDKTLGSSAPNGDEVTRSVQLGLLCVQERAIDRPTMFDVVFMLRNQSLALPLPKELHS